MGAGASRKYVVEEIRAATQADVARACAELSTQDKDKLIVLLEASEQVQQDLAPGHSDSPEGAVAEKEPRSVPRNQVEASGCEAPTGVLVDPGKARCARSRDALSAFRFLPSSVSSDSMLTCRRDSARRKLYLNFFYFEKSSLEIAP